MFAVVWFKIVKLSCILREEMFTECCWLQNRDRMTRTSVYMLIVTELLDDWEDARTLGEYAEVT